MRLVCDFEAEIENGMVPILPKRERELGIKFGLK